MRQRILVGVLALAPALAGCSRETGLFSEPNARAHVEMLAGTIGSRPIGTDANARARAYLIDQLKLYGLEVRVQETDARRAPLGRTAHVSNIIGVLPGARPEAIGLVAHYDSAPTSPGAADDALGVAVVLETARVMAARKDRQWTILVLLTDGEESGLLGAAALMTDRAVTDRLNAYINVESSGSSWPAMLFETGPANGWIVGPWARRAPHPRGGSYSVEIYRRLPNDTDFSILKQQDVPGLNFATVGDSHAYHTARDLPERISSRTMRYLGENVAATVIALGAVDITQRSMRDAVYFDIGGTVAASFGSLPGWILSFLAVLLGTLAWIRVLRFSTTLAGTARWVLTLVWTAIGAAVVAAAMVGATWALRAAREVYHPWYSTPDRLLLLLALVGATLGWGVVRLGRWLPERAHGLRHPVVTWSLALPLWIALALAALWVAPAAAYLWTLPLLVAGALLLVAPPGSGAGVRIASLVVLAVAATLWLRDTVELFRFAMAVFGRLPIITPVFAYAALVSAAGIVLVPPLVATVGAARPILRPSIVTTICLFAVAAAGAFAYAAPAYTHDQPLRRYVRALQEAGAPSATWEVASVEPGLDLETTAPGGWVRVTDPPQASVPWGALPHPFVFRTSGPALGAAPVSVSDLAATSIEGGSELSLTVVPRTPGLAVAFVLPPGITPARSSLPGVSRRGRWTAVFIAPPRDGIAWRASFSNIPPERLADVRVAVTDFGFPGGTGWQRLPAWLPQEHVAWTATATWVVAPAAPAPLEPVPPLR
jgi:hypothetical protein